MEQKEVVRPSTLDQSSSQEHEEEMEGLRVELEKKTRMLLEVKTHLKQLAEREKEREGEQELVTRERDELREQVKMVRTLTLKQYSGTSDKGPSEIGTTSLQRTLVGAPC